MGVRIPHKMIGGVKHKRCSKHKRFYPLSEFTTQRSTWDGLSSSCRKAQKEKRDSEEKITDGVSKVYAIIVQDRLKIGLTTRIKEPLLQRYRSHNGYPVHLILLTHCGSKDEAASLEKELHTIFKHRHVHREWFQLSEECEILPEEEYHTHLNRRKFP